MKIQVSKGIPVTGQGPQGCEMSRLPHQLDYRITVSGDICFVCWLPFTLRNIPDTHFYSGLGQTRGYNMAGRIRSIDKSRDLTWNCNLPACSIEPQSAMPLCDMKSHSFYFPIKSSIYFLLWNPVIEIPYTFLYTYIKHHLKIIVAFLANHWTELKMMNMW
jgi:hypothetical protein